MPSQKQEFSFPGQTADQETRQAEEIDKVMKQSRSNLYVTYGIIAINVVVFILMVINGAGIFDANATVHIGWGSNYSPLTLSGDWWRLVTSMFIHFGIIHLAMNTYALYIAGIYLEPMIGKTKYIVAYLATGVFASLASLWWHSEGVNSAGASGAIFGLYGVFLALLFTNLIPKQTRSSLLGSIGVFVVFNLLYGTKSGVDNAAHIGGLVSGLIIGFIFYPLLKKDDKGAKSNLALLAILAGAVFSAWIYLSSPGNKVDARGRQRALNELTDISSSDAGKFSDKMEAIIGLQTEALAPLNEKLDYSELSQKLNTISVAKWQTILSLLNETKNYDISERNKNRRDLWIEYAKARQEEISAIEKVAKGEMPANNGQEAVINEKIEGLVKQINDLN